MTATEPYRIANISGFYGDRISAAHEMVSPSSPLATPVHVLTGDYLAELTMMILLKDRARDENGGYARTFLRQLQEVAKDCARKNIKIVTNAGGLNPAGCADACRRALASADLSAAERDQMRVAHVEGDDILDRLGEIQAAGEELRHLDRDVPLRDLGEDILSANVYLGAFGIVEAMRNGAGVVVTPRVTDASVVVGPAAWNFGWGREDYDQLAGAVVAGHIIECGTQCTGGNYRFFKEIKDLRRAGFPIADMHADGSFVITKHPGTGGEVSVGTVTAQLLYEIQSERYANPDVVVRLDTLRIEQVGEDQVRVWGVRGEPAPEKLKVCMNYQGGFKNSLTMNLTGADHDEKAALAQEQFWGFLAGAKAWEESDESGRSPAEIGRAQFAETAVHFRKGEPFSLLTLAARDPEEKKLSRGFWNAAIEMALASYPGFQMVSSSKRAAEVTIYWPALVGRQFISERVILEDAGGEGAGAVLDIEEPRLPRPVVEIEPVSVGAAGTEDEFYRTDALTADAAFAAAIGGCDGVQGVGLSAFLGGRSGDKGGNCNVGVWARSVPAYHWVLEHLTPDWFREAYPEARDLVIDRYELPGLLAVNFVVRGLLGEGVSASLRPDPQAKMVAEELIATVL